MFLVYFDVHFHLLMNEFFDFFPLAVLFYLPVNMDMVVLHN